MGRPLRLLIIQENEDDARPVVGELERCGWDVAWERVGTREGMAEALDRSRFDMAISDHPLPHLPAPEALALWKERGLDGPFLVVSGTVEEEEAGEVLKAGAHDFFLRGRLSRFCSAVERELRAAEGRRALRRAEEEMETALQSVRRGERLIHDLFESAPEATLIVETGGVIQTASRQAERLFGYEREELSGKTAEDLLHSSERADDRRFQEGWVGTPSPPDSEATPQRLLALRKDGSTLPVEVSSRLMGPGAGLVVAGIRDATDLHRLELHLREVQRLEWVGRVAGGFAHEVNNMLGVILGLSELTLRGMPPEHPQRARLEKVLSATERAAGLSRELLAFGRKQNAETSVLDLNQIIQGLRTVMSLLLAKDVEIRFRPGEGLGLISADAAQMEQLLLNLIFNACDAMPSGGRLDIATSNAELDEDYGRIHARAAPGRHICLTVSDTGKGMDRELQARIFRPFFTTKEPGRGAGLGLATVDGIVRQSDGFVHLSSEPGRGTTFKIYLPRADAPSDERADTSPATRRDETVLLVEDAASLRELLNELLEASGYTVLGAEGPAQAIETAEGHEGVIDLLLTDVLMPGMNGPELARRVKERRPGVRVLYMSGDTEDAISGMRVLEAGALLISKPFTPESLARRVREALGRREPG